MTKGTIVPMVILWSACVAACGDGTTAVPAAPPVQTAAPNRSIAGTPVAALGDKKAPFESTTALDVVAAARTAGVHLSGDTKADKSLCAKYAGCRSAATVGAVKVIVFRSATAAQDYGRSSKGAEVERAGGRRYGSLVDYSSLGPNDQAAWRDLQREIIPS